jgi:tRNA nucleotidyltransferase (CCA-adding enzyme)
MTLSIAPTDPLVDHGVVSAFAVEKVNLPREEVAAHRAQVNRLRSHLQRLIDAHDQYSLVKTLHSGSVAKGTAMRSVADMDVAAYLDASQVPVEDHRKVINELGSILRAAYGGAKAPEDFEEQAHSVRVRFHGSGLDVDVAPVIYAGLPDDRGDLVTRDGRRVETSVRLHLDFIRRRKSEYGGSYTQVIRLLKFWAREQKRVRGDGFRCKSFMLELVVAYLCRAGLWLGDYPSALERAFAWIVQTDMAERVWFDDFYESAALPDETGDPMQVFDPVNPENNVCRTYTEADRRALVDAATDALDAITAARYGTTKAYAFACWQRVFGPTFRG